MNLNLRFGNHSSFVFQISVDWELLAFFQETYNSQNLRNETLVIANHEYDKFSKSDFLEFELSYLIKDDDLHLCYVALNFHSNSFIYSMCCFLLTITLSRKLENIHIFLSAIAIVSFLEFGEL